MQELSSGATLAAVKQLFASALPGWLEEFARLLSKPLSAEVGHSLLWIRGWKGQGHLGCPGHVLLMLSKPLSAEVGWDVAAVWI